MTPGPGRVLRALAHLLVRGEAAPFVLGDLEESLRRDIARGLSVRRARGRYLRNLLTSAWSLARCRAPRRAAPSVLWLDVKLGLRMLLKYPGLTLVAVFALSLGIPASLFPLHLFNVFSADLPFDEGDRIVGLRYRYVDVLEDRPGTAFELELWRDQLSGLADVAAARPDRFNVVGTDGQVAPVRGSEMTASAFRLLKVPPLLGRPLDDADEVPGAPDVVVLGHDLWRARFARDPKVVGKMAIVGGEPHTVVGVMPENFLFPVHDDLWIPLRTASTDEPASGPDLLIFARLAEGITLEQVLARMESLHAGQVERFPVALGDLRPQIATYLDLVTENAGSSEDRALIAIMQVFTLLLLAVACGNVGTLILARTSTRSGELAIRTALGASRPRLIGQLFLESLVLALVATAVGLGIAHYVTGRFSETVLSTSELPFWLSFRLNRSTVMQAMALSVFCAVVAGVVPALKVTGGGIRGSLQKATAARSGVRFGGVTSALIVVEVALGVGCLFAGGVALLMAPRGAAHMEIETERVLTASVDVGRPAGLPADVEETPEARQVRVALVHDEIVRRLRSEPGIHGAVLTGTLPGGAHSIGRLEIEGGDRGPHGRGHRILIGHVGVGYFEALGVPVVEGRTFRESDLEVYAQEGDAPVIVNTTFADRVFQGRQAIGQRLRYVAREDEEPGRWYEVVGVAPRVGMYNFDGVGDDAGLYHPIARGERNPMSIALRVDGNPMAWVPRLRDIVSATDASALVERPMPVAQLIEENGAGISWALLAAGVVAGIAIVLSVAGLYALMSFTVAQRTREIGVRTALGANARRITWLIARRAMLQLAGGIVLGVTVSLLFVRGAAPELLTWINADLALWGAAGAVLLVGALSCIAPTVRGLGIQPMEALRVDG